MSEPEIDLAYIGRALQRLTSLRDDMNVLTAIAHGLGHGAPGRHHRGAAQRDSRHALPIVAPRQPGQAT